MIEYPSLEQVLRLHERALASTGGDPGIRDVGLIESALAQPQHTFGGEDLYPTIPEKGAALAFSLVANHAFVDGNKRVGYAMARIFLLENGWDLTPNSQEREQIFLALAGGTLSQDEFKDWFVSHARAL